METPGWEFVAGAFFHLIEAALWPAVVLWLAHQHKPHIADVLSNVARKSGI